MLASLLPGFREVRSPLVAGYLWLVAIWITLDRLGLSDDLAESDAADALDALTKQLSVAGVAIAGSFAAYVLGAIWEAARGSVAAARTGYVDTSGEGRELADQLARRWFRETDAIVRRKLGGSAEPWLERILKSLDTSDLENPFKAIADRSSEDKPDENRMGKIRVVNESRTWSALYEAALDSPRDQWWSETEVATTVHLDDFVPGIMFDVVTALFDEGQPLTRTPHRTDALAGAKRADSADIHIVTYSTITQTIINDLPLTARRLVGEQQEIYLELDRMKAEVDFRLTVAMPLLAALVAVGLTLPLGLGIAAVITGIVVAAALTLDGVRRNRNRNDVLIDLLRIEKATSPTLARIAERVKAIPDSSAASGEPVARSV